MIVGLEAAFQIIILKHRKFASVRYEQDNTQISEDTCNYFKISLYYNSTDMVTLQFSKQ